MAAVPSSDSLSLARRLLASPHQGERDQGEALLIGARDAAVPVLVEVLGDRPGAGPWPVARAALLLGALKARDALPALYALVERGELDSDARAVVARALAEILDGRDAFDDRSRAVAERLAADSDRDVRAFAAHVFVALGDLRSRARIQALAADTDPWVRDQATAMLARLAEAEARAQADIAPADFAALLAQAEAEGGALKPYLDDLDDPRRAVRDGAVAELVRAGKPAVPWLIEKLNQPRPRPRIGAALALGRLQATEAAGPLIVAATAPAATADERELRAVALRALAGCLTGDEEGLAPSLLPLARDPDRFVRAAALLCLGRLGERAGLRAIVAAILEEDPFVVESAAVALSEGVREDNHEITGPLLLALERRPPPSAAVKEAVLIALSRVDVSAPPLRVRVRHRVRHELNSATASARKAAIVLLERLYGDDDPPPLPLLDDVLLRLDDNHPEVRLVAASFVRTHLPSGMSNALGRIEGALARGEVPASLCLLEALRRHDTAEARAILKNALTAEALQPVARALLDGFTPQTLLWVFTPKARVEPPRATPIPFRPVPPGPEAPRVTRVRFAGAAEPTDTVAARFDDDMEPDRKAQAP